MLSNEDYADSNPKNKNMRLLLGKGLINTGERPGSFCNTGYFILKVRSIVPPLESDATGLALQFSRQGTRILVV